MNEARKLPVAVITGGSSGIGRGIAKYLIEKNSHNIVLVARSEDKLKATVKELSPLARDAEIKMLPLDVSNYTDLCNKLSFLQEDNIDLDLLVNSAGYVKRGTTDLSINEFEKMVKTNLIGPFNLISFLSKKMKEQKQGRIINIASISAVQPRAELGGYAASKSGLMGLNESLYKELTPFGIYVTAICPNLVATEMTSDVTTIEENEFITVEDITQVIHMLLTVSSNVLIKEIVLQNRAKFIKSQG